MAMDLWEHAYYLDYQNQKANHYKEFMKIINWEKVEERYKKAALNQ
ncbi:MAG: Fe-Mn family superoxide dismutase [Nanoarchaeota archaeon]